MRVFGFLLVVPALASFVAAATDPIPDAELVRGPSVAQLDALVAAAGVEGWGRAVPALRDAAHRAYAREPASAAPWYCLYRWAKLLSTPRAKAVGDWIAAVENAGGGHANMPTRYEMPPGSLASLVRPELQRWLAGASEFSREFFETVGELDQPVEVLRLLDRLYREDPAMFADYASLALAIAIVYDVPPPPDWPHGQVSARLLPRRLPEPTEAYWHWVRLDRARVTAHRLRQLSAAELKFVVDASAPLADLSWAQRHVTPPISELAKAYDMVAYRKDRLANGQFMWPGQDYRLPTIQREGGICVDQAYFATNVGKARGVPTLLFRGAGLDGRHAWFGFLAPGGWRMDAGRYAEQKYVTGFARDPQTWRELSDHEILFLSERFQRTPLFQLASIHADFAAEYLQAGNPEAARKAAREAVSREARHLRGWQLLAATSGPGPEGAKRREGVLREAMLALQKYPDLEREFGRQWIESLRTRGETSVAEAEERRLVRKYQGSRTDLGVQQVAEMLQRSLREDDLATQVRVYQRLLDQHGRGAGTDFFDKVVVRFVEHLWAKGEIPAARDALKRARQTLRVETGSQLEDEMKRLEVRLSPRK